MRQPAFKHMRDIYTTKQQYNHTTNTATPGRLGTTRSAEAGRNPQACLDHPIQPTSKY